MGTSKKPSDEDRRLFREAVGEVKPLKSTPPLPEKSKPKPVPRQKIADERQVMQDLMNHQWDPASLESGEELQYQRPGLSKADFRRLRKGQFSVRAELDLHGHNAEQAKSAVMSFLNNCLEQQIRCVRIIHGKGLRSSASGPVLKPLVERMLRQRDEILGFSSARPVDGGSGAVYVLLKKRV